MLLAGGVAGAYIAAVVGLHRLNVRRMRKAGGFSSLRWLDWDGLLEGLLPPSHGTQSGPASPVFGGGPGPALLARAPSRGAEERQALLCAVVAGQPVAQPVLEAAAFSGGQARWVRTLSLVASDPDAALERLMDAKLGTPSELYLREYLLLTRRTHALNLEVSVFSTKRRLTQALARFGDHPSLFFVRAMASSLLGFNRAAIDDLARAVYFSHQAPFYVQAVLATPSIEEARPALSRQCRLVLYPPPKVG